MMSIFLQESAFRHPDGQVTLISLKIDIFLFIHEDFYHKKNSLFSKSKSKSKKKTYATYLFSKLCTIFSNKILITK